MVVSGLSTRTLSDDFSQTITSVPDVYAPSIGGTQPCIVPYSAAGAIVGFGAALGGGIVDEGCEHRNYAAMLFNIGHSDVAAAYLCMMEPKLAEAFKRIGKDCFKKSITQEQVDQGKAAILAEIFRQKDSVVDTVLDLY